MQLLKKDRPSLRARVRDHVIRGASKAGYELIADWKLERQPLVRHLRKLFAQERIDCVFDVGGNLGQYRDLLRDDVGFGGWIFSFEPVSTYVEVLRARAANDPKWRVLGHALGNSDDPLEIHVTRSPGLNSFLAPRTDALPEFWSAGEVSRVETVAIHRLDDIYEGLRKEYGFSAPYLKLDTQGYDLEVAKGATKTMASFRALQSEASVVPIYTDMPTHDETRAHLEAAGFALSGMFAVTLDDRMRLVEYDCVMVNTRALV
jgi:FkbM family methyltransferase